MCTDSRNRKLLHYNTTTAIIYLSVLVLISGEITEIVETSEAIYDIGFWILMVKKSVYERRRRENLTKDNRPLQV